MMKMTRKFMLFFLMAFTLSLEKADASTYEFVVWLNDGSKVAYSLDKRPCFMLIDNAYMLYSNDMSIFVFYPYSDVKKFTLRDMDDANEDTPTSVDSFHKRGQMVSMDEGIFLLSENPPHSKIMLYTIEGELVKTFMADETGCCIITVQDYPKGHYIVKSNSASFKFMKK